MYRSYETLSYFISSFNNLSWKIDAHCSSYCCKTENILLIFGHLDVLFINKLIEIHNSPLKIFYKINKICIIHINDNDNYYQLKDRWKLNGKIFLFQFISSVLGNWIGQIGLNWFVLPHIITQFI